MLFLARQRPKFPKFVLKTRFKAKPFQRAQICEDRLLRTGKLQITNMTLLAYTGQRHKRAYNKKIIILSKSMDMREVSTCRKVFYRVLLGTPSFYQGDLAVK
jgi:hypothetical protein